MFVTGTDTGVGKTVLAAAIVAALRRRGVTATGLKPVLTGLDDPADPVWPRDHELLARVSGRRPDEVALALFGPAASPHLAGELAGTELDVARLRRQIMARLKREEPIIVEGVGGLLVPLLLGYDVRALAADLGLPVVVVARPGLGTINHTLLTLEAACAAKLTVVGVVLTPWPDSPDQVALSNRRTIERLGGVPVFGLGTVGAPKPDLLADAAHALPLDDWLASATVSSCATRSSPR